MLLTNSPTSTGLLRLERRKSFSLGVRFTNAREVPLDITDCTLTFVMGKQLGGTVVATKTLEILDAEDGVSQLLLQATDTDLPAGTYDGVLTLLTAEDYSASVVKFEIELVDNPDPSTTGVYSGGGFSTGIAVAIGSQQQLVVKQADLPAVGTPGPAGADGAPGPAGADGAPGAPGADASRGPVVINTQTDNYTLVASDKTKLVRMNKGTAVNLTVPPDTFNVGDVVSAVQSGAGQVTLVAGAGVTLNSAAGLKTASQYSVVELLMVSANTWLVYGRTAT